MSPLARKPMSTASTTNRAKSSDVFMPSARIESSVGACGDDGSWRPTIIDTA
jgi:hypothetical protein